MFSAPVLLKKKRLFLLSWNVFLFLVFAGIPVNAVECESCSDCDDKVDSNSYVALNQSIENLTATCITVGQSDVVIDCKGYLINGSGFGYGVYTNGYINVTMKNCSISDFVYGIYVLSANNFSVVDSNSSGNSNRGLYVWNSYYANITNTIFDTNTQWGIYLDNASNSYLYNNTIENTGSYDGLRILNSENVTIEKNTFSDNGGLNDVNLRLIDSSYGSISNNDFSASGNTYYGISIEKSSGSATGNNIMNNTFTTHAWAGLYSIGATSTTIYNNTFDNVGGGDNAAASIKLTNTSTNNNISSNTIKNSYDVGIIVSSSSSNTLDSNTITDSASYGIYIDGNSDYADILNNVIKGAPSGGIVLTGLGQNAPFIYNNTITNTSNALGYGIEIQDDSDDANITANNITFAANNALKLTNVQGGSPTDVTMIQYNFLRYSSGDDVAFGGTIGNMSMIDNALTKSFACPSGINNNCSGNIIANLIVDNDSNPIRDYSNISDAINAAGSGYRIFVYDGAYNESITITKSNLEIEGESRENTILNYSVLPIVEIKNADNVNLTNFSYYSGNTSFQTPVLLIDDSNNTLIKLGNFIKNTIEGWAVGFSGNSNFNSLIENVFSGFRYTIMTDSYYQKDSYEIKGNTINETMNCISAENAANSAIENNNFTDIYPSSACINITGGKNITITNNFFRNYSTGIDALSGNFNITVDSNSFANGTASFRIGLNSTNPANNSEIKNNVFDNATNLSIFYGFSGLFSNNTFYSSDLHVYGKENNLTTNSFDFESLFSIYDENNTVSRNTFNASSSYFVENNTYCVNGWDNDYNQSIGTWAECYANFTAGWNDSLIYVNSTVRLTINLTGKSEIKELNATISWNDTSRNYSLSYLENGNISGAWYLDFSDTSYNGTYNITDIYRKDADSDAGSHAVYAEFEAGILELDATLTPETANISDRIHFYVNVTNNASDIENVTAYILKPDNYTEVLEMKNSISIANSNYYRLQYKNATRSGNYSVNITVYAGNTKTAEKSFFVNYGTLKAGLFEAPPEIANDTVFPQRFYLQVYGGDVEGVNITLYSNNTDAINVSNGETWTKTFNLILNSTSTGSNLWNLTSGTSSNWAFLNITATASNGAVEYYTDSYVQNKTIYVNSSYVDTEAPNVSAWLQYDIINLNQSLYVYANITDAGILDSYFFEMTYPNESLENITLDSCPTETNPYRYCKDFSETIQLTNETNFYNITVYANDSEGNTGNSAPVSFNTTDQYKNITFNLYSLYNRGENVTLNITVYDVNSLAVSGYTTDVRNLSYPNGNITKSANWTDWFYIYKGNQTGEYAWHVNVSKDGNTIGGNWSFNVSSTLDVAVFNPASSYQPTKGVELTVKFRVSNIRGDAYPYDANFTGHCYLSSGGLWGSNNETNGTYTGSNITWDQSAQICYAAPTENTQFNMTFNVTDNVYNNSGLSVHYWTTKSQGGGEDSSGGDDGGGTTSVSMGAGPGPVETEKIIEDFDFVIKDDSPSVTRGESTGVVGVIENKGNVDLKIKAYLIRECCSITMEKEFEVKAKNKVNFPIDIYTNLTTEPGEYLITIKMVYGSLQKTETITLTVKENPLITELNQLYEKLKNLEEKIKEYESSGMDASDLKNRFWNIETILEEANASIERNDLAALKSGVEKSSSEISSLNRELLRLKLSRWLHENKEELLIGTVSTILILIFITKFMLPYIWMKRELMDLAKREKELVEVKKSTEKQYFRRQIDEPTFNRIMTEKHSTLTEVRTEIKELNRNLYLLKHGKIGSISMETERYSISGKLGKRFSRATEIIKAPLKHDMTLIEHKIRHITHLLSGSSKVEKEKGLKLLKGYRDNLVRKSKELEKEYAMRKIDEKTFKSRMEKYKEKIDKINRSFETEEKGLKQKRDAKELEKIKKFMEEKEKLDQVKEKEKKIKDEIHRLEEKEKGVESEEQKSKEELKKVSREKEELKKKLNKK